MARVTATVWSFAILVLFIGSAIAENGKREVDAYGVSLRFAGSKVAKGYMTNWASSFKSATHDMVKAFYGELQTGVAKQYFKDSNAVDMIVSDLPLTTEEANEIQSKRQTAVAHMPLAVAGLAIAYNKESVNYSNLQLSPTTLAKIFNGQITKWNHDEIKAENPELNSELTIKPIVIESGTSYVLSRYLSNFARATWGNSISYAIDAGENKLEAETPAEVLSLLAATPGAIAYVSFADATTLNVAPIKNPSGNYVAPTLDSLSAAAASPVTALPASGTGTFNDAHLLGSTAATAYPIAFYTYAIFLTNQDDAGSNGAALGAFLLWSQSASAQNDLKDYHFAPLASSVLDLNINKTMPNVQYATGVATTDYWPYIAPAAPTPTAPIPVAAPTLKTVASSGLQITIIVILVILIILVIGYDQYRGGCIVKCNSTGRGIWA